ncbi:right-handed parallel beta-helix repeat-containing protein [uncultured Methanobrevibacter sp.]|uniref:right-handed parallel beta-helix repeat-containing protein n=1 Tax=uncultured Methanobrevibacter sp. TaxID=253161 RepID=UPI0025CF577B|nr:right-handed parallel beta-helix repeat-containing protein [uncultured Methanobrevibacter sp.]
MKTKGIILISLILLILLASLGTAAASEIKEIDNGENSAMEMEENFAIDTTISENEKISNSKIEEKIIEENIENEIIVDENLDENDNYIDSKSKSPSKLGASNLQSTIVVDGSATNQMSNPTIQNAIDSAQSGDTIIITGTSYVHCHFVVNKKLTIISNVGTAMTPCPSNTRGSGTFGLFYISPEASGTVIQGFTLTNTIDEYDAYGILVRGASDVKIINCTINTTKYADGIRLEGADNTVIDNSIIKNSTTGINIVNSTNTAIQNSIVQDSNTGINIVNSTKTTITNNNIRNNGLYGVNIDENNQNTTIDSNNITDNKGFGIRIISANYIYILSNFIAYNQKDGSGAGVYVNCNLTKIEIKGNFFKQNGQYGVLNDYRVRNMDAKTGADKLEINNNNYYLGHTERLAYHIDYKKFNGGAFIYDSEKDEYIYVGDGNGNYDVDKSVIYLADGFFDAETICGATLYKPPNIAWMEGEHKLLISEITQVKRGTYQISIVNKNGTIATDFNSIYVTFYLNKNNKYSEPQEGDVYQKVLMKNGTATVTFREKDYLPSGNVLTAIFPGLFEDYTVRSNLYKTFNISDSDIPKESIGSKITVSNMNTYPNSGASFQAILKDSYGIPLANKTIKLNLNGKTYTRTTDANGKVKLEIKSAVEKTYTITVSFDGDKEYNKSSAKASIVVKRTAQKIISSNKIFAPNKAYYYSITLKDGSNKVIANKNVKFIFNKKTYNAKTNSKGIAKIKIKSSAVKTFKITIKSVMTNKYKAISKTNKITIKALAQKIISYNKRFAPNKAYYYCITLKDQNNQVITNKKISIKIGAKKYARKTNRNGIAKIKVKSSKKKTYKVTIISPKTKQYNAKSKANKIVFTSLRQKILSSNKKYLPKAGAYYSITLKDENNQVIKNKNVRFTINSKNTHVKTNSKGIAKLKIDLTNEKVYTLKIYSPATYQYRSIVKTNKITIAKGTPKMTGYDRTYSTNSNGEYSIYLRDYAGKALSNGKMSFVIDGKTYSATTDSKGIAKFNINIATAGNYSLVSKFLGDIKNKAISKANSITIKEGSNISFVDKSLPNSDIQKILDSTPTGNTVEFLGESYSNINLKVNKSLNLITNCGTKLNGLSKSPVFSINADNVNVSNFIITPNSQNGDSDGIAISKSNNVNIVNNTIINSLDSSKIEDYNNGSTILPGTGIKIQNSENINLYGNVINSFESGIYNDYSSNISMRENEIRLNNYGIKYGFGSNNTEIINNTIIDNIGWYTEDVPEGPRGYGLYLNSSAVNITISQNNISNNYIGISVDSNNSTGIVITGNLITDNSLEGIRFNAGYDLAENCVEPIVTSNAIYRNAEGPSMMILSEMSANPFGIYGPGEWDDDLKLKIGPNWYGVNHLRTWDNDTGVVGVGTMCPRIKTTEIKFDAIESETPGTYIINFKKDGSLDTNLPIFDMYATLNNGTDKQTEVHFSVINGTGSFSFEKEDYYDSNNKIEISVGSLINIVDRRYSVIYTYEVPDGEIPV